MNSGIGGYGTIVIYDARKREARFLNSSGRMPFAVDSDAFRAPTPNYLQNRSGAKAVSTPGNLHAWEALSKTYGTLEWLAVESGISEQVRRELEAMGHKIQVTRGLGNGTGLMIEYDRAGTPVRFTGAADPRGEGRAIGY